MSVLRLVFDRWGEPNPRKIEQAVEVLHRGGVAAYPTDSHQAIEVRAFSAWPRA